MASYSKDYQIMKFNYYYYYFLPLWPIVVGAYSHILMKTAHLQGFSYLHGLQ